MSHIFNREEELKKTQEFIELIRHKGYSKKTLEEILEQIMPQSEEYKVKSEINYSGYPAYFLGYNGIIHINEASLKDYIIKLVNEIIKLYPKLQSQKQELISYITLFTLFHETEHAYQYMFGQEYLDNPYNLVTNGYKYLTDFHYKENMPSIWISILIERYKQQKDKSEFILERNANVESYDLLNKLAKSENNEKIQRFMNNQYLWYCALGYLKMKNNGALEESYRNIWRHKLYKSFDFTEDIPLEDRIRYGLPLEHSSRKELLKKFIATKDNF